MASESCVLLGLPDEVVGNRTTNWDISKIGGKPDWMSGNVDEATRCPQCSRLRSLVAQVYCPLALSPFHRCLYVFVCVSPQCKAYIDRWCVVRCQSFDSSYKSSTTSDSRSSTQDDWGDGGGSETVTMAMDEWCEEADDWGDEPSLNAASEKSNPTTNSSRDCDSNDLSDDPSELMKQMNVDDMDDDESHDVCEPVTPCIAEDVPLAPPRSVAEIISEGKETCEPDSESEVLFVSRYISVLEEGLMEKSDMSSHERKLLQVYSQKEGVDISAMMDIGSGQRKGSGGGGEKYESTEVHHGDKVFHKFMKKVSTCPRQILRYCRDGQPLLVKKTSIVVPPCESCGKQREFELQLMPALVSLLTPGGSTGIMVEFGTVLVYTCRGSCWEENSHYKREYIIVQADPDEQLFKR